ncbi:MAG: hypothetical protein Aurels2KO_49900 [Aureliella sp.]
MNCTSEESYGGHIGKAQMPTKWFSTLWTAWRAVEWPHVAAVCSFLLCLALLGTRSSLGQATAANTEGITTGGATAIREHIYDLPSVGAAEATLRQPARFQIRKVELSRALENIASSYRITIWLDRRIDPSYSITLRASGGDLAAALQQISRLAKAEMQLIENVVYIGPTGAPNRLAAAAAVLFHSIQTTGSARMKQTVQLSWDALTTPNELLRSTGSKGRLRIAGELPHDLLREGDFQRPSHLATCLALICVGHDQMCVLSGPQEIRLAPLRSDARWWGDYPLSAVTSEQADVLRKMPGVETRRAGDRWLVSGTADSHRSVGRGAHTIGGVGPGRRPPRARRHGESGGDARLSGDIAGTVENVAKQLAQMRMLSLAWDATCTESQRQKRVSFHVENATFAQIVESFSQAAGLQIVLSAEEMSLAP